MAENESKMAKNNMKIIIMAKQMKIMKKYRRKLVSSKIMKWAKKMENNEIIWRVKGH